MMVDPLTPLLVTTTVCPAWGAADPPPVGRVTLVVGAELVDDDDEDPEGTGAALVVSDVVCVAALKFPAASSAIK